MRPIGASRSASHYWQEAQKNTLTNNSLGANEVSKSSAPKSREELALPIDFAAAELAFLISQVGKKHSSERLISQK